MVDFCRMIIVALVYLVLLVFIQILGVNLDVLTSMGGYLESKGYSKGTNDNYLWMLLLAELLDPIMVSILLKIGLKSWKKKSNPLQNRITVASGHHLKHMNFLTYINKQIHYYVLD
jgi:hypothetical protein